MIFWCTAAPTQEFVFPSCDPPGMAGSYFKEYTIQRNETLNKREVSVHSVVTGMYLELVQLNYLQLLIFGHDFHLYGVIHFKGSMKSTVFSVLTSIWLTRLLVIFSCATIHYKIGRDCVHEDVEGPPRQAVSLICLLVLSFLWWEHNVHLWWKL